MDINVYIHPDATTKEMFGKILAALDQLKQRGNKMDQDIQNLIDEVAEVKGDTASTKAFIAGLEQRITDILSSENLKPETTAALKQAFADLKGSSQELKDAIDNDPNTPPPAP